MRILYILSDTKMGGATLSAITLMKGMLNYGGEVIAVIPDGVPGELIDYLIKLDIKYYSLPICFCSYPPKETAKDIVLFTFKLFKRLIAINKTTRQIIQIAKKENVSIIHTNIGPINIGFRASQKLNIPHVWHIREYGDKDFNLIPFPNKRHFRNTLKKSNVVCITKDLLKYNCLENYEKAKVIYNGVRSEKESAYSNKENYFLCASRISPEKGFDQIIRVFSIFCKSHTDFKLIILGFGDVDYIDLLKRKCELLNIKDNVVFEGFRTNVSEYMLHAKALLVASPAEGFGRMTAEAYFAGCLVIGKNTGGTKEILDLLDGEKFNSDDEFLYCMEKIYNLDESIYQNRSKAAQNKAIKLFSTENYIKSMLDLYHEILNK